MHRDSFLKMASQNVDDTTSAGMATGEGNQPGKASHSNVPAAANRLRQELLALMTCGDAMVSAFPEDQDIFDWAATIQGPAGTAYENLVYRLRMKFPQNYPCAGPVVQFETPCFHPNVDEVGNICLDILKDQWTALLDALCCFPSSPCWPGAQCGQSVERLRRRDLDEPGTVQKSCAG
ncbi:hypothetical protein HPB48_008825 [Haemaphysalis longicornis]|uniref:UBC core domain-containing protein n=1 Tax=Haemaphysalis longicornis TaxID=44386 RepID=A0A9J6G889_HAELO|nr:hypothetical protein HPB48_008825 [Haemaphysalis longicornis]